MRVLVLNAGSATLKFQLREVGASQDRRLAGGSIEGIGKAGRYRFSAEHGAPLEGQLRSAGYREAVVAALDWLGQVPGVGAIEAVGHRVVHGGERFHGPALASRGASPGTPPPSTPMYSPWTRNR